MSDQATYDFGFNDTHAATIAALAHREFGLKFEPAKNHLIYTRLTRRLRALRMKDFGDYCAFMQSDAGAEERTQLLSALTTNVTQFFREKHHFDFLANEIMPALLQRGPGQNRLRFWSAACSSGQEPYSLAMTIASKLPVGAAQDIKILASDIDPQILITARKGLYTAEDAGGIPDHLRAQYTKAAPGDYVAMDQALRKMIAFRELNLIADWPMRGSFDLIMCRNVAIYFDKPTQEVLWQKFADKLPLGCLLYTSPSPRDS